MTQRERLPNRRPHIAFSFQFDTQVYHCTASRFPDGRVGEIFLSTSKAGSTAQQHAECAAILCSLALQSGVNPETIISAVGGPIGTALELAMAP
jgi:ribonucleoside-diphosphate reductase alpha chain